MLVLLRHVVPLAVIAAALIGLRPSAAGACVTVPPPPNLDWGAPLDGATDVPTDVVLLYALSWDEVGRETAVPGTFVLRDEGGRDVAFTLRRTHRMAFEIVPSARLAPNTAYTLQATWERGDDELQFTTGNGPFAPAPVQRYYEGGVGEVEGVLLHYSASELGTSCDPPRTGTCVRLAPADAIVEYALVDQSNEPWDPQFVMGSFWTNLSGVDQGHPFECLILRKRAANGTLSGATRVCGKEYPLRFPDTTRGLECTAAAGLTLNGKRVPSGADCSASPSRGSASPPLAFVALLLCLLGYRLKFWTDQMRPALVVKKPHATLVARVLVMLMKWP